jgi:DNA-binding HxlR family transcriptional regulator
MSPGHSAFPAEACQSVGEGLSRVGDKWSELIVAMLLERPQRFSALHRAIEDTSRSMLTLTLRGLERDGLVRRTVRLSIPPKVEYALTPLGRNLHEPVSAIAQWAVEHRNQIEAARERSDARQPLDSETTPPQKS